MSQISAVVAALANTIAMEGKSSDVPSGYTAGFVRVKPDGSNRGSFVEGLTSLEVTQEFLGGLEWQEAERSALPVGAAHPDTAVRYFKASLPSSVTARTGILALKDCDGEVRVVNGNHGQELQMLWEGNLASTTQVWAVVGPVEGSENSALWTWYPGPIGVFATPRHKELMSKWQSGGRASLTESELAELADLPVKLKRS